jgi:hypothetical protein
MRDDKHKVHIYNEVLDKQSTLKPTKGSEYNSFTELVKTSHDFH